MIQAFYATCSDQNRDVQGKENMSCQAPAVPEYRSGFGSVRT
jgi:hypothetical protein